jgi:hypothetical protein
MKRLAGLWKKIADGWTVRRIGAVYPSALASRAPRRNNHRHKASMVAHRGRW